MIGFAQMAKGKKMNKYLEKEQAIKEIRAYFSEEISKLLTHEEEGFDDVITDAEIASLILRFNKELGARINDIPDAKVVLLRGLENLDLKDCVLTTENLEAFGEPKRGKWNKISLSYIECSVCKQSRPFTEKTNYCPNCGARMNWMNWEEVDD